MTWKLNGTALGTANVKVTVAPGSGAAALKHRVDAAALPYLREKLVHHGRDYPDAALRVEIVNGSLAQRLAEADFILQTLDDLGHRVAWFEETNGVALWRNWTRWAFQVAEIKQGMPNAGKVTLEVKGWLLGKWVSDSGTVYEVRSGWIQKTGATTWVDQDGTAWSTQPRILLPRQHTGYPKAVRQSDLTLQTLSVVGAFSTETNRDSQSRHTGEYDLTGMLHPAVSAIGDVGTFEVHSVPTANYLAYLTG